MSINRFEAAANRALNAVVVPILSGWQDMHLTQTMRQYQALDERGLDVTLTVGPWTHLQVVSGDRELARRQP